MTICNPNSPAPAPSSLHTKAEKEAAEAKEAAEKKKRYMRMKAAQAAAKDAVQFVTGSWRKAHRTTLFEGAHVMKNPFHEGMWRICVRYGRIKRTRDVKSRENMAAFQEQAKSMMRSLYHDTECRLCGKTAPKHTGSCHHPTF